MLGGRADELSSRVESLMTRLRESEKELEKIRMNQALAQAGELAAGAHRIGPALLVHAAVGVMPSADALRALAIEVRDRLGDEQPAAVALIGLVNSKPQVVAVTNESGRAHALKAGALVRILAQRLGGGGGGRDDIAQGGGTKPENIDEALEAIREEIQNL